MLRIFINKQKHRQDLAKLEKLEQEQNIESKVLLNQLRAKRKKYESLYSSYISEIEKIRKITIEYYQLKKSIFVLGRKIQQLSLGGGKMDKKTKIPKNATRLNKKGKVLE